MCDTINQPDAREETETRITTIGLVNSATESIYEKLTIEQLDWLLSEYFGATAFNDYKDDIYLHFETSISPF